MMVIGDEAVPSVIGHIQKDGRNSCCWVLKKEHLGLEEVAKMLARINQDSRIEDQLVNWLRRLERRLDGGSAPGSSTGHVLWS